MGETAQNKTKAVLSIGKLTPERWGAQMGWKVLPAHWHREVPSAPKGDPAMGD